MSSETLKPAPGSDLDKLSKDISKMNMMPLWERAGGMKPGDNCVPARWRYTDVRPELVRASKLIAKKEAERRVLVLENPSLRGTTYVTSTLYAGLQIILPGEIAPSHRHTPNALRFVVEGEGAYTAVDGEQLSMHPGDFIVTPNWAWHDHGNLGSDPVVWLDGLDTPFTKFLGTTFREDMTEERQNLFRKEGDSFAAFGSNMLPVDFKPDSPQSPVLHYPYARTRKALAHLAGTTDIHPAHATKLRYANPATGRHPFSTMAVFMQLLPKGFVGKDYRSTDGTVFCIVEGNGRFVAAGETFEVAEHDVAVAPSWTSYHFEADTEMVIFSYSDRAGQEALGFWQEQYPVQ
ncbi:MAG: hypothetical protein RLZ98_1460 [Pseudomonadota bacterium]